MNDRLSAMLKEEPVSVSAPCRVDMGGTVDLPSFHYALRHLEPATVNAAVNLRTTVTLFAGEPGFVEIESKGFAPARFPALMAPLSNNPLGLMFAVAAYFNASGVKIRIESASPVRSALGGSSSAAVALFFAFAAVGEKLGKQTLTLRQTALTVQILESASAQVVCGLQDHLAAAYGGVNLWTWPASPDGIGFVKQELVSPKDKENLDSACALAYCGIPHDSVDINGIWLKDFLAGRTYSHWEAIIAATKSFAEALAQKDWTAAAKAMDKELGLRMELTPGVVTPEMGRFIAAARQNGCGARFTGAGGGGCVWSMGQPKAIEKTRQDWREIAQGIEGAKVLPFETAFEGVMRIAG
jgi:D-glycero-alpha-D-manno-heptose-7-phosphate kinase